MYNVVVIGGMTIDIEGVPHQILRDKDSNPGEVKFSYGGVGKNISQNLVKLGIDTRIISAVGDDANGESVIAYSKSHGINTDDVVVLKDQQTAVYMSILDHNRDMALAVINMDTFDHITIEDIQKRSKLLKEADLIVMDTNLSSSLIKEITEMFKDRKIFLDPVSTVKAEKVKTYIGNFAMIKPNKMEAELLSNIKINNEADLEKAGVFFSNQGIEYVFITLDKEGVYYKHKDESGIIKGAEVKAISATGAGDAFSAGVIYGYLNNYSVKDMAIQGCSASVIALQDEETVSNHMTIEHVEAMKIKYFKKE